ncbi:MAG: hypothetical protein ACK5NN_03715 [Sphingomonadaceae bacterium]
MKSPQPRAITSKDWFGKAVAAFALGLTFALALSSVFYLLLSPDQDPYNAFGQLAMWLVAPVWCGIIGLCFLFRSTLRAWGWLGGGNILVWSLYGLMRFSVG